MSIEAISYAKTIDLGENESAAVRLLLYVIGENTFNDSFVCRLTQTQLGYEAGRISDRTVRRHLDALEAGRIILRPGKRKRVAETGQLGGDVIRLVGFKRWYYRDHGPAKKRFEKGPADKMAAGQNGRWPADNRCPQASGQQVSGPYKDTRTSKSVPLARERASEDLNLVLEGKGVRDRLRQTLGGPKFGAWLSDMSFEEGRDGVAVATCADKLKSAWAIKHFSQAILTACQAEWPGVRTVTIRQGKPTTRLPEPA